MDNANSGLNGGAVPQSSLTGSGGEGFARRSDGGAAGRPPKGAPRGTQGKEPLTFTWFKPEGMWALSFVISILKMMTMGIYGFWGRTEVRRRIWTAIRLNGQPLEYTGTGKELFYGFMVVFFLIILPLAIMGIFPLLYVVVLPITLYLTGVAQYRARKYRLTRTNWRGIRGGMGGSSWRYGWTYLWTSILVPLTLGWITPWRNTKLNTILTNETQFGALPMSFSANPAPLYPSFAVVWLLRAVVLGAVGGGGYLFFVSNPEFFAVFQGDAETPPPEAIMLIFGAYALFFLLWIVWAVIGALYEVVEMNYFAAHTSYEGAQFQLTATSGSYISMIIGNWLLRIFTLGIGVPVVQTRMAAYVMTRLSLHGQVDLAKIAQNQQILSKTGEGLADAFEVDGF